MSPLNKGILIQGLMLAALMIVLTAAALVLMGVVAPPQAEAVASGCWQVCEPTPSGGLCCNTCCRTSGGIVCTDRACP